MILSSKDLVLSFSEVVNKTYFRDIVVCSVIDDINEKNNLYDGFGFSDDSL